MAVAAAAAAALSNPFSFLCIIGSLTSTKRVLPPLFRSPPFPLQSKRLNQDMPRYWVIFYIPPESLQKRKAFWMDSVWLSTTDPMDANRCITFTCTYSVADK